MWFEILIFSCCLKVNSFAEIINVGKEFQKEKSLNYCIMSSKFSNDNEGKFKKNYKRKGGVV